MGQIYVTEQTLKWNNLFEIQYAFPNTVNNIEKYSKYKIEWSWGYCKRFSVHIFNCREEVYAYVFYLYVVDIASFEVGCGVVLMFGVISHFSYGHFVCDGSSCCWPSSRAVSLIRGILFISRSSRLVPSCVGMSRVWIVWILKVNFRSYLGVVLKNSWVACWQYQFCAILISKMLKINTRIRWKLTHTDQYLNVQYFTI